MARGSNAKIEVIKKISEIFKDDFIGEFDKKVYVWANDGGERVQIAISLTCPKTPIVADKNIRIESGDYDFTDDTPTNFATAVVEAPPAEITQEEQDNIAKMMSRLGLI